MKVQNAQTGEVREVSAADAAALYDQGGWALEKGAEIPMRSAHGNLVAVSPDQLPTAAAEGFTVADEGEFRKADLEARYGTPEQMALTGAEGVGRGLTVGFYDAIANGIDPEYAKDAAIRADVNPGTAIAGEVAGTVAPLLLSGGGSAVARGAETVGALPRLAAGLGRVAEGGAARVLGRGAESVAGRALQRAGAAAVGGAAEALPSAIGHQVSRAMVEDREILSEQVLAGIGLETLTGGLAGGILGGASSIAQDGAAAARRAFDHVAPGLESKIVKASSMMSGASEANIEGAWRGRGALGQTETVAPVQMAQQIGSVQRALNSARAVMPEQAAEPVARAMRTMQTLEDAGLMVEGRVNPRVVDEYLGSVTNPKTDVVHSQLRSLVDDATAAVETSRKLAPNPKLDDLASKVDELRGTLGDVEGGTIARNQFGALSSADGGSGAVVRGMLGGMIGGAPGAAIGTTLGVLSRPQDVIRKVASIERVARLVDAKIEGGLLGYLARVGKGAKAPIRSGIGKAATSAAQREDPVKTYKRLRTDLDRAVADPEGRRAAVAHSVRNIRDVAPEVADAIETKANAATEFLASKIPRVPAETLSPLTPHLVDASAIPKSELIKFQRYARAVEDPSVMVKDLASGALTRETVEAIKTVYPAVYQRVRTTVIEGLGKMKSKPPYQARMKLSLLLDIDGDPSLRPQHIVGLQDALTLPEPAQPRAGMGSPSKSMSENIMSNLDRLEGILS